MAALCRNTPTERGGQNPVWLIKNHMSQAQSNHFKSLWVCTFTLNTFDLVRSTAAENIWMLRFPLHILIWLKSYKPCNTLKCSSLWVNSTIYLNTPQRGQDTSVITVNKWFACEVEFILNPVSQSLRSSTFTPHTTKVKPGAPSRYILREICESSDQRSYLGK